VHRQERRKACIWTSRSDRVVVNNGQCYCCAKYPEVTHVKLRSEASLGWGKCGGQYKRELILPSKRGSFSGDAVECLS
jgi:hypothetical protein